MKKSNVIRVSKQPLNFPSDQSTALQLNKSQPSLIEFLESPTVNAHFRDSLKEHPTPTDQSLKPRTHTKVPSKRLAILLDAYADQSVNRLHQTVDVGKKSSREPSVKSPQNISEDIPKPNHARQLTSTTNIKGGEFLKSRDFSKLMVSKVLGKNNQKYNGQERETKNTPEIQEFQPEMKLMKQQSEASFFRHPVKRISKPLTREEKKNEHSRDDSSKETKLRRIKVIYNNNNSIQGEKGALNVSQPHTTKHYPYSSYSALNATVSPTLKTTLSPMRKIDRTMVHHHRLSTSPCHPDTSSSSFQFNMNQTVQARSKERERKENHKKTVSTSGTLTLGFEVPRARANISSKDLLSGHRKGASGVLAASSSSLITKPQSDTDRELALRTSVEHPKANYSRLPIEKILTLTGSGGETLLSESTTRHDENSEKGSGFRQTMPLKSGDKSRKVFDESSQIGLEPFQKFENAFYAFSEHHLKGVDPKYHASELEKVIKAWNVFTEVFRAKGEKEGVNDYVTKTKLKIGSDIMILQDRVQGIEYVQDTLSNSKHLMASVLTNSVDHRNNNESFALNKQQTLEQNSYVNDPLQQIVQEQKQLINTLKRNEEKMMKLICTIKRQGYDVEKIYWDEVKKTGDDYMQNYEFSDLSKHEEETTHFAESQVIKEFSRRSSQAESSMVASVDVSMSENPSFGPGGHIGFEGSHNNLNFELKSKLKLNFNDLSSHNKTSSNINNPPVAKLDLNIFAKSDEDNQEQRQGFHEEFMSKIDEFSLSWRQAAKNERNF